MACTPQEIPNFCLELSTCIQKIHSNVLMVSFPPYIEDEKEILEFSEAEGGMKNFQRQGRNFLGGGVKFFWIRQGGELKIATQK